MVSKVYRFLDCAIVLKQLDGFSILPGRERLCRTLKQLGRNRNDIRKLWDSVLSKVCQEQNSITSPTICQVWGALIANGEVTAVMSPNETNSDLQSELPVIDRSIYLDDDNGNVHYNEPQYSQQSQSLSPCDEWNATGPIRNSHSSSRSFGTQQSYHPYQNPQSLKNSQIPPQYPFDDKKPLSLHQPNTYELGNSNPNPNLGTNFEYDYEFESEFSNFRPQISTNMPNWRWKDSFSDDRTSNSEISQADVQNCVKLLHRFSQRGYVLQPALNGRWVDSEVIQHWRLAPVVTNDNNSSTTRPPIVLTKHTRSETTSPPKTLDTYSAQLQPTPESRNYLDPPAPRKSYENKIPSIFDHSNIPVGMSGINNRYVVPDINQ
ncbi:hypothetical protein HK096_007357, partial [Nowakowskiella sp. JEL0078]